MQNAMYIVHLQEKEVFGFAEQAYKSRTAKVKSVEQVNFEVLTNLIHNIGQYFDSLEIHKNHRRF